MHVSKTEAAELSVMIVLAAFVSVSLVYQPFYVVVSGSMMPALKVDDVVVIQHVPISAVKIGDIAVFHEPNAAGGCDQLRIVHRVVGFGPNGTLITKGDANANIDEPGSWPYVGSNCFVGKVVFAVPYVGYVWSLLPYPSDVVLAIAVIAVMILAEYFMSERPAQLTNQ